MFLTLLTRWRLRHCLETQTPTLGLHAASTTSQIDGMDCFRPSRVVRPSHPNVTFNGISQWTLT